MRKLVFYFLLQVSLFGNTQFKYNVERYDTFESVSSQFKIDMEDLISLNNLSNSRYLYVGQVLNIPVAYNYQPPYSRNLDEIMSNPVDNWRNPGFEVYIWDKSPKVLVFDTINYSFQSLMFKRLAFYVEKKDYIGNIYSLAELEGEKGWNGHDYESEDLADFFNKISDQGQEITKGEEILLDILTRNSILKLTSSGYIPLGGAVISCSRSSFYNQRYTILKHEALHGLYFTSSEFRDITAEAWNSLSELGKSIWIMYMDFLDYGTRDLDLVMNEFMAYLLQQTEEETYYYFKNVVYYRLYFNYPNKRFDIDNFFSNNRYPFREQISMLNKYSDKMFR